MAKEFRADICVIGAGSAGLSTAAGAAQLGAKTVLIENHKMGGDCLNTGCVPSKSMIAAAHAVEVARRGGMKFGLPGRRVSVDFSAVHSHVHGVIAQIAPHDSVERFESLGVKVLQGTGKFRSPRVVEVYRNKTLIARVWARRFVIATGSHAAIPKITGLKTSGYLTNETIFDLTERPDHLLIMGAGPIGIEMAQAHRRLGCRVTVVSNAGLLRAMDPDLSDILRQRLKAEGVECVEHAAVSKVEKNESGVTLSYREGNSHFSESDQKIRKLTGSHLLIATGRVPSLKGLGLEYAGVAYTQRGIEVDRRMRTTNKKIFAIGDVAGGLQFTHVAGYHAGIVIRNALFRIPARADHSAVPMVTYSDPEVAQIGLSEAEARKVDPTCQTLEAKFSENDRAQAEQETEGKIKAYVRANGKILGVSIIGPHAGELLQPWCLAMSSGLKIGNLATMIAPYPTLGEINKRVAGSFYTPKLFSTRTRLIVKALSFFG